MKQFGILQQDRFQPFEVVQRVDIALPEQRVKGVEHQRGLAELFQRDIHQHRAGAVVDHIDGYAARLREHIAAHAVEAEHLHAPAHLRAQAVKKGFFGLKGALVGNEQQHLFLAALYQLLYAVMDRGSLARAASS